MTSSLLPQGCAAPPDAHREGTRSSWRGAEAAILVNGGHGNLLSEEIGQRSREMQGGRRSDWTAVMVRRDRNVVGLRERGAKSTITLGWSKGESPRLLFATDSTGRSVAYTHDAGMLSAVTDVTGAQWQFKYDADRLATIIDPVGRPLFRAAYSGGRVASIDGVEGRAEFAYSDAGSGVTTSMSSANGGSTTYTHNPRAKSWAFARMGRGSRSLMMTSAG